MNDMKNLLAPSSPAAGGKPAVGVFRLQPPRQRPDLVARPALLDALDRSFQHRLVLLFAPAGYGKTTLLTQWWERLIQRCECAAWITLDEQSRGGPEFLISIVQALGAAGVDVGELGAGPSQALDVMGPTRALNTLLFALDRIAAPIVLILDDYHFAQSPETDELLNMFIRRMNENVHVVMASRRRPALAVPALRANFQVLELGVNRLRFSLEESRQMLGPKLSDRDMDAINAKAEGWAIALQLAGLWMQDHDSTASLLHSFSGSIDDIADYLTTQIFSGLPAALQSFLVETSIFDQFNAELADAARGSSNSASSMETLKRLNGLLIPIDAAQAWVRYHHLIADFLTLRRQGLGRKRLRALHRSSSTWFEAHGDMTAAVRHAIAADDRARAVTLIERADGVILCLQQGLARLKSLFSHLHEAEIQSSHRLRLVNAVIFLKQGELDAADAEFEAARAFDEKGDDTHDMFHRDLLIFVVLRACYRDAEMPAAGHDQFKRLSAAALHIEPFLLAFLNNMFCVIYIRMGDLEEAKRFAYNALDIFNSIGYRYGCMFMNIHLGTIFLAQGFLSDSLIALQAAEAIIIDHFGADRSLLALVQIPMAQAAYEQNDFDLASRRLDENLEIVSTSEGWPQIFVIGYGVAANQEFARAGVDAALVVLNRGLCVARKNRLWRVEAFLMACHAGLLVRAGRLDETGALLCDIDAFLVGKPAMSWVEADELAIAKARLALAVGHVEAGFQASHGLAVDAERNGRLQTLIRAEILFARALRQLDRIDEAMAVLRRVLERAQGAGVRRPFIDEGLPMADLLRETVKTCGSSIPGRALQSFITDLRSAFVATGRSDQKTNVLATLTPRESEILKALAGGGANKVIARTFDLTEDAVKFHLKNIYRKLGVSGRATAANVARKLDPIS
jgi:LuxR family maltose regulon positive regulatory protein